MPGRTHARANRRFAIFDIDGVLVDNSAFESAVTESIVEHVSRELRIGPEEARSLWDRELNATRGDVRWFDYDFHCTRLGVKPQALAAHKRWLGLLTTFAGALGTWEQLSNKMAELVIATDATDWVARLKLAALGVVGDYPVLSSATLGAAKARPAFWRTLFDSTGPMEDDVVVVDNRLQNLIAVRLAHPAATCVHFDGIEHVATLGPELSPHMPASGTVGDDFVSVSTHGELQRYLDARWD